MISKATAPVAALLVIALMTAGCHRERKAEADTGTAEATVKTKAPVNEVSNSALQQEAQAAATAASTPVDGSKMNTLSPNTPPAPANATH